MKHSDPIKYCQACGTPVVYRVPDDGDTRERAVCPACGKIHYVNPLMVVGTVPYLDDRVLLCKRAIEPRYGKWTLPAGFMEEGETIEEGAARETLEEAQARVDIEQLYVTLSLPQISQVYMLFRARLVDLDFGAGPESLEVRLFHEHEIPWDELAFRTISEALKHFYADRKTGVFPAHLGKLIHDKR